MWVPLFLTGGAAAAPCLPWGTVSDVVDNEVEPQAPTGRLVYAHRTSPGAGERAVVRLAVGAVVCEGDILEVLRGATATVVRTDGVGLQASGGSLVELGEPPRQLRGVVDWVVADWSPGASTVRGRPLEDVLLFGRTPWGVCVSHSAFRVSVDEISGELRLQVSDAGERSDGLHRVQICDRTRPVGPPVLEGQVATVARGQVAVVAEVDPSVRAVHARLDATVEATRAEELASTKFAVDRLWCRGRPTAIEVDGSAVFNPGWRRRFVPGWWSPIVPLRLEPGSHEVTLRTGDSTCRQRVSVLPDGSVLVAPVER